MTLSQKETSLLQDLKSQEQLCIDKYSKYESEANDACLKSLFSEIKGTEQNHLSTVNRLLNGEQVEMTSAPEKSQKFTCTPSPCNEAEKKHDAFLCKDALAMEKHVSSVYDTAIFEFSCPSTRDVLNHIQKEEQQHGEKIYDYMSQNNMY